MTMRNLLLAGIAAASLSSASAGAVVFTTNLSVQLPTDTPSSFNIFGGGPLGPLFGQISIRVDMGFVIADGARNGAALGLSSSPNAPASLLTVSTERSGTSETVVLQIGTPQNFTGAGGSPGQVTIVAKPTKNFTSAPVTFTSNQPGGAVEGDARALHVSGAGIAFDGNAGDGAEIQLGINPEIVSATLSPAGSAGVGAAAGPAPITTGFQGSDSATGLDCSPCNLDTVLSFTIGADDVAAVIARSEVGRELPPGDVVWTYQPAPVTTIFDCGSEGCDSLDTLLSFSISGLDAAVVVTRIEILAIDAPPVPAPASLGLLGVAVAGIGVMRRRRRD